MKIIVAPDSYKGCLSAREVAGVISETIGETCPDAEIITIPLADGGEGTVEILGEALGAKIQTATVTDPLGRKVQAKYAVKGDTAIIEVAEACGMKLLRKEELTPPQSQHKGSGGTPDCGKGKRRKPPYNRPWRHRHLRRRGRNDDGPGHP